MSERVVGTPYVHIRHVHGDGGYQYTTRPATPSEIANAFWSLWWGANSKPTVDQIEAVQTACKVVGEIPGESDE